MEDELGSFSEHRTHVFDPLEPINRAIFAFNHEFYRFVIRPVADGYEFILPKIVREGIDNVYENLTFPVRFVNHGLQGRFDRAGKELGAFVVNSVAGIGGVWHPSEKIEFLKDIPKADTGQTFAKWGIGHGPYLVLPVLGPTTVRDFVGMVGDYALNPVSWATFAFGGEVWTLAITSPNTVRTLPKRMDEYDAATKHAIDRYTSARMTYIHFRNKHAKR
ncbi:MAG: VacJ family lipoprotein [Chthoniobacterales bacterium]|nr:VacJ family lipoprotein [Chthoniobacterales bacterium]